MSEGPLISVVDDDMSIRNATQDLLRAAGFSTAAFSNATSFLDSPSREHTACLVADMRMPGMSGLELHQHLVASGAGDLSVRRTLLRTLAVGVGTLGVSYAAGRVLF